MEVLKKIPPQELGLSDQEDYKFIEPIEVKAKLEKSTNTILADTDIEYQYSSFCARCLEPIKKIWKNNFLFHFPKKEFPEIIDLGEEIRQEIVIDIPIRMLCQEDCKGLCIRCGANLNSEECKCKK